MVKSNSHWYLENLMPKHPVQGIKVENVGNAQTRFPRQMFDLSLYGLEQEAIRPQYYEALFHEVSLPCQNQSLENEFWKSDIRRSGVGKGLKCDIWRPCLCGLPLIHLTLLYAEDSTGFFNPGLPALQMLLSWHGGEVETFETAKHIFSHDLHMPSFRIFSTVWAPTKSCGSFQLRTTSFILQAICESWHYLAAARDRQFQKKSWIELSTVLYPCLSMTSNI